MNAGGIPYGISNPDPANPQGYKANFENVSMEYFDVYAIVETRYSQVYWTRDAPVPLPADLIKRFDGKVMAITGYEVDQIMTSDPSSKTNARETDDTPVPIYNAYNHHYFGWLNGKDSEMYELGELDYHLTNPTKWAVRDLPGAHNTLDQTGSVNYPTNIVFKENPGGEYRKSYHGYPRGFAQLLHSPTNFVTEPMQIDTHNRAYNATDPQGYKPSFLPKAVMNHSNLHSGYSPLIECPCSDRITRKIVNQTAVLISKSCPANIATAAGCAAAVAAIAPLSTSKTIADSTKPSGCTMVPDAGGDTYTAVFNTAQSKATCDDSTDNSTDEWTGEWTRVPKAQIDGAYFLHG
jgi:hypothetical protein